MPFMERLQSALILGTPMYDPSAGEIIEHTGDAFYNAIRGDNSATLLAMIEGGFNVDFHAFGHEPPLILAVKKERIAIIELLLEYGANPNLKDPDGNTALHYAVRMALPEAILSLLRHGAGTTIANTQDETPLSLTRTFKLKSIAALLKEHSFADRPAGPTQDLFALAMAGDLQTLVTLELEHSQLLTGDARRQTLLHHAVFGHNTRLITWLISKGIGIDHADLHGMTPLLLAAAHPKLLHSLRTLLRYSPTLEHRSNNQATALTLALRNGNPQGAKLLIEHGANILTHDGLHTPLTLVHRGIETYPGLIETYRELLTLLMDHGAHMEISTNKSGWTPLFHTAARMQDAAMKKHLQLLIQLGSDVNAVDTNGRTPLMVAASMGRRFAVETLLKNYAAIDSIDHYGWSALMLAVYYNHIDVSRFLLEQGCNVNLTSTQGLSALRIAKKLQRKRVRELLLEYGAADDGVME